MFVGSSCCKIARKSNTQGLVDSLFEAMMGLLDISIFMSYADIVPSRLHAIMSHECLISNGPLFFFQLAQVTDCRTQMVCAMLLRNPTNLPERFFDALSQGFKRLAEADTGCFHI